MPGTAPAHHPADDDQDLAYADRGFVARLRPGVVRDAAGRTVRDAETYAFLYGDCPPTANPSLWGRAA